MPHLRSETPRLEGGRIYRFVFAERVFHGLNALLFLLLAATGAALLFRWPWQLSPATVHALRCVHFGIGIVYFAGPAVALFAIDPGAARRWAGELVGWSRDDLLWLLGPLRRGGALNTGRFNAGQRLYLTAQVAGKGCLFVTGLAMFLVHGLIAAFVLHVVLSGLLVGLALGHIYLGLVNPPTRRSLPAMFSGYVDADWLRRHHRGWFEDLARKQEPPR